jgi:outer membrane lipoprotein-sorting protein
MKWKLWKYNGVYIQGELISQHNTEATAIKRAKKEIDFHKSVKEQRNGETIIWLDAEDGTPLGIITKKQTEKE